MRKLLAFLMVATLAVSLTACDTEVIEQLTGDLTNVSELADTLAADLETLQEQLDAAAATIDELETAQADTEAALADAVAALNVARTELDLAEADVEDLEEALAATDLALALLEGQVTVDLDAESAELQAIIDEVNQARLDLQHILHDNAIPSNLSTKLDSWSVGKVKVHLPDNEWGSPEWDEWVSEYRFYYVSEWMSEEQFIEGGYLDMEPDVTCTNLTCNNLAPAGNGNIWTVIIPIDEEEVPVIRSSSYNMNPQTLFVDTWGIASHNGAGYDIVIDTTGRNFDNEFVGFAASTLDLDAAIQAVKDAATLRQGEIDNANWMLSDANWMAQMSYETLTNEEEALQDLIDDGAAQVDIDAQQAIVDTATANFNAAMDNVATLQTALDALVAEIDAEIAAAQAALDLLVVDIDAMPEDGIITSVDAAVDNYTYTIVWENVIYNDWGSVITDFHGNEVTTLSYEVLNFDIPAYYEYTATVNTDDTATLSWPATNFEYSYVEVYELGMGNWGPDWWSPDTTMIGTVNYVDGTSFTTPVVTDKDLHSYGIKFYDDLGVQISVGWNDPVVQVQVNTYGTITVNDDGSITVDISNHPWGTDFEAWALWKMPPGNIGFEVAIDSDISAIEWVDEDGNTQPGVTVYESGDTPLFLNGTYRIHAYYFGAEDPFGNRPLLGEDFFTITIDVDGNVPE